MSGSRPPWGKLFALAALAFVATAAAMSLWPRPAPIESGTEMGSSGRSLIGGPFALTDQNGKLRTDRDFRGKHMLVFFGFTHCPDVCPTALYNVSLAMQKLGGKADRLVPVFVSVDPERDTPDKLKNYGDNFDRRIVLLTGSPEEVAAAARAYRVYFAKKPLDKPGEYTIDHSAFIYLMDREGRYVTHFRHGIEPDALAEALARHL